ncbi:MULTISPECIES: hypothetical protein [Bacillus cereus group]|uniref:Uncharacterized protein n=1 Tax=Bacillus thuringiensis serovar mexicanensis TaxID=180868 RepID=A0A242WA97_BACTU|nr:MULTISPECIES: hypothetical protein [Bacillus cereus group]MEB9673306.1 hypothetical protein [Bacillus anthracis]OTW50723.1 hypothetical protein BK699_09210 [Bacillus thuringiensis serovar mexicanensis]OTX09408.1 hypothetical protein BK705_04255 [Bacillus thuringiensis serovar monterrey]
MDIRKVKDFTGKVGTEFMSFLIEGDKLHSAFYSKVEVIMEDGAKKMICIKDDTALKGIAEGHTRAEAIKKAKYFLKRQKKNKEQPAKTNFSSIMDCG